MADAAGSVFVGRTGELARFEAAWADVRAGTSRTLLVGGEAGIGKTRLIEVFGSGIVTSGALVASGGSPATPESALPFAAVVQLLRGVGRNLDAGQAEQVIGPAAAALSLLLPGLAATSSAPDEPGGRMALFEAILGAVERLAEVRGPSMLVLEDLQWADRSTRDLFGYLVHSLRDVEILLVGTYRTDEIPAGHPLRVQLAELGRLDRVGRVELPRLSREEISQLVAAVTGRPVSAAAAALVATRSDGNPYFAEEIARSLVDGQGDFPPTLREILVSRLAGIPAGLDQLIRVCATIGTRFDQRILEAVVAIGPGELGQLVRDAVQRGVLTLEADAGRDVLGFRQTLLRQVAYEGLVGAERRRFHEAIARVLDGHREYVAGPRALVDGEIARQWVLAEAPTPARAALIRAGESAEASFAFPEAAIAFEQALQLWDLAGHDEQADGEHQPIGFRPERARAVDEVQGPVRAEIVRRAAEAHSLSGRPDRATALIEDLLRSDTTQEDAAGDWFRLGRYAMATGDATRALTSFERAADLAAPDGRLAARIATARASALISSGRYGEARVMAETAIAAADAADSQSIRQSARELHGVALALEGDLDRGLAELSEARAASAATVHQSVISPRPSRIGDVVRGLEGYARVLDRAGRPTLVAETAREGSDLARRLGVQDTLGGRMAAIAARSSFLVGDWEGADRATRGLLDNPRDPETDARVHALRAQLATGRGAFDDAAAHVVLAREAGVRLGDPSVHAEIDTAAAELAIWRRQLSEAREVVDRAVRRLHGAEDRVPIIGLAWLGLRAEADRADIARATRDGGEVSDAVATGTALRAEVIALTRQLADRTAAAPRELRALSALAEAEWTRLEGRTDEASWETAGIRSADVRDPWLAAYAGWREAEARLATRGDRSRAELVLRTALDRARNLGAAPLIDEIAALGRRARVSLEADAVAAPPPPSTAATLGLSERELEVLALVAEGYTNRRIGEALFITEKTAGHHVSNLLGKLGLASRVEAAALAHRLGLLADLPARE